MKKNIKRKNHGEMEIEDGKQNIAINLVTLNSWSLETFSAREQFANVRLEVKIGKVSRRPKSSRSSPSSQVFVSFKS